MNLLIPVQAETLIAQNTMPPKVSDSVDAQSGASFQEHLDGVRTEASQEIPSKQTPQGKRKEYKEKKGDESSKAADNATTSGNAPTIAACNDACRVRADEKTGAASGDDTGSTSSSQNGGQETDKPVAAADVIPFPVTHSQHAGAEKQDELSAVISDLTKTNPKGSPVRTKKEGISLINSSTQKSSFSAADADGTNDASEENALVQNVSQSSEKETQIPDSVRAAAAEAEAPADGSHQRRASVAGPNMSATSGEGRKILSESPGTRLTHPRAAGEKDPGSAYVHTTSDGNMAEEQVSETVLPVTPKIAESDISSVRKGEVADFSKKGNPADKTDNGKSNGNDTAQASSTAADLSEGTRSQPNKSFMQSVKLEQMVPQKGAGAEHDLNEIRKTETELTYQTNEKSGELFAIQDSNTVTTAGLKVVHQKAEITDISQLSRENFVITRKDNTSLELSIEPEGIGKLDIHLSLDKGTIHARINASEDLGKDFIDRNMNNILQTLSDEGINIGSFSINLRDRKNEFVNDEQDGKAYPGTTKEAKVPILHTGNSTINIFV